jgi:hypothetical protein
MNTTLLDQFIEPFAECLTQDAARKIVAIRADAAFHFVTILQSRARRFIQP